MFANFGADVWSPPSFVAEDVAQIPLAPSGVTAAPTAAALAEPMIPMRATVAAPKTNWMLYGGVALVAALVLFKKK